MKKNAINKSLEKPELPHHRKEGYTEGQCILK